MKRLLSILLFSSSLAAFASAQLIDPAQIIDASERGWVCTGPSSGCPNNGADPGNNYFAGFTSASQFRDWFEFTIPTLPGSLLSATLNLDEPLLGHDGGSLTYDVYGLTTQPMMFTDVTTSNLFGSVATSSASSGTTISITLDSAALAAIAMHQGGNIFIGGIDSGETSSTLAGDFARTGGLPPVGVTSLKLNTAPAPVPEPASIVLFASLLIGSLVALRRKTRSAE
jgi:hypothetical protein